MSDEGGVGADVERITLYLTPGEAKQLVDDLRRLDAHVIARGAGGIEPSKRRGEIRRRLKAILDARLGGHRGTNPKRHPWFVQDVPAPELPPECLVNRSSGDEGAEERSRTGLCEKHGRVPVAIGSHDQAEICPYCGRDLDGIRPAGERADEIPGHPEADRAPEDKR